MSSAWPDIQGVNEGYVEELYERFRRDPHAVDPATRSFFEGTRPGTAPGPNSATPAREARTPERSPRISEPPNPRTIVRAITLAQSIRLYGHLAASIDPLGGRPQGDPSLLPRPTV